MCGSASLWAKIAFVVILIALILDIVGFATIHWMIYQTTSISVKVGLWRMESCVGTSCIEDSVNESLQTGTFRATQVFEICAFIFFVAATAAVGAYVFAASARGPCMALIAMVLCFSACFCAFIGMICWLVYVEDPYVTSWSMGLTILAAILALIAGLLLVPDFLDQGHPGRSYPPPPNFKGGRVSSPPNSRFVMR